MGRGASRKTAEKQGGWKGKNRKANTLEEGIPLIDCYGNLSSVQEPAEDNSSEQKVSLQPQILLSKIKTKSEKKKKKKKPNVQPVPEGKKSASLATCGLVTAQKLTFHALHDQNLTKYLDIFNI